MKTTTYSKKILLLPITVVNMTNRTRQIHFSIEKYPSVLFVLFIFIITKHFAGLAFTGVHDPDISFPGLKTQLPKKM